MSSNTQTSGGKLASGGNTKKVTSFAGSSGNDWIQSDLATIYGDGNQSGPKAKFGNDVIYGGTSAQSIYGEGGNDWIHGGGGADMLDGGAGVDWVSFQPNSNNGDPYSYGVAVNLDLGMFSYDPNGFGFGEDYVNGTAINFENVWGSEAGDYIVGNSSSNDLHGGAGEDWIDGQAGDDEIEGGQGADYLLGGSGADKFEFKLGDSGLTVYGEDSLDIIADYNGEDGDHIEANFDYFSAELAGGVLTFFSGEDTDFDGIPDTKLDELMSIMVSGSPSSVKVNGIDVTDTGGGGGGGGGGGTYNGYVVDLYGEVTNVGNFAAWDFWGLDGSAIATTYNETNFPSSEPGTSDPYVILYGYIFDVSATYTNSDIASAVFYENTANAEFTADHIGITRYAGDPASTSYEFLGTWGVSGFDPVNIGTNDYVEITFVGGDVATIYF